MAEHPDKAEGALLFILGSLACNRDPLNIDFRVAAARLGHTQARNWSDFVNSQALHTNLHLHRTALHCEHSHIPQFQSTLLTFYLHTASKNSRNSSKAPNATPSSTAK